MYYSNGNYGAFARPHKSAGVDKRHAYTVGAGSAGLSAVVFLVRDTQIPDENIHIFEELLIAGGSLDGQGHPDTGFITRDGREIEDRFEYMWDVYRSIPSLEIPGTSCLDEYYWPDKNDPNSSNCRLTHKRGNEVPTNDKYLLGESTKELMKLIPIPKNQPGNLTIGDYFSESFFKSNFWIY